MRIGVALLAGFFFTSCAWSRGRLSEETRTVEMSLSETRRLNLREWIPDPAADIVECAAPRLVRDIVEVTVSDDRLRSVIEPAIQSILSRFLEMDKMEGTMERGTQRVELKETGHESVAWALLLGYLSSFAAGVFGAAVWYRKRPKRD